VTPRLLLCHGWALDRTLWDGVLQALGDDAADAAIFDAGYYGDPGPWPPLDDGRPLLGVGQSLGSLELLTAPPAPLAGIVVIDGFARFSRAEDFPAGLPARVMARMREWLAEDGEVLLDFLRRAGGQIPAGADFDIPRLSAGLERLETLDGREAARTLPIWRLHSQRDAIAPLALADASFEGCNVIARRIRAAGDHLSPIHAPQACADIIRAAMKVLA
jgi:pimeloyl-[acyl-carrier protein] methyl ester esterase